LVSETAHGVASNDGLSLAPEPPDGGAMPSFSIPVLNIIVDEREVMNKFKRDGNGKGIPPVPAQGLAGKETKNGSQPFTPNGWTVQRRAVLVTPAQMVSLHHREQGWVMGNDKPYGSFQFSLIPGEKAW
jgi:hypothetical protein